MTLDDKINELSERVRTYSDSMSTEEAVKTAIVLPFLSALDYDIFNPGEVVPEFTADAVGKKGEKVDYAIKQDGEITILIECKALTTSLAQTHLAQLYRYFSVTAAKFAILTNGRQFNFYSDLVSPNKLDERPFLIIDLLDIQSNQISELKKFAKSEFNIDGILQSAQRLKYTSFIKAEISKIIDAPPEEFVRLVTSELVSGRYTAAVVEQFTPLVKSAFRDIVKESIHSRLTSALAESDDTTAMEQVDAEEEIITTDEEKEGFMVVRAIVRDVIKSTRVVIRDQKSYCGILIDDNNRKPLARLHFNRSVKYIGLFDGDNEDRVKIESIDDIYDYSERLRAAAQKYLEA